MTLTPRELQVAKLIALGKDRKEVAAILGISDKTYDTHRGHVLTKLSFTNSAQLTRWALKEGHVTLEGFMILPVEDK